MRSRNRCSKCLRKPETKEWESRSLLITSWQGDLLTRSKFNSSNCQEEVLLKIKTILVDQELVMSYQTVETRKRKLQWWATFTTLKRVAEPQKWTLLMKCRPTSPTSTGLIYATTQTRLELSIWKIRSDLLLQNYSLSTYFYVRAPWWCQTHLLLDLPAPNSKAITSLMRTRPESL